MKISSNINSMMIVANMNSANNSASKAMKRLSSGLRIGSVQDDPAGWAIAKKLDAQVSGLNRASKNSMDAISLVQTTEGALNEVHSMLNRLKELGTQSINDSTQSKDREAIQSEVDGLIAEIKSISQRTQFNGIDLLNSDDKIMIQTGANAYEDMTIDGEDLKLDGLLDILKGFSVKKKEDSPIIQEIEKIMKDETKSATDKITAIKDSLAQDGATVQRKLDSNLDLVFKDIETALENIDGASTEADKQAALKNVEKVLTSPDNNELNNEHSILNKVDEAIDLVSAIRGKLGAFQNRLEHTIENLGVSEENATSSLSRIQDADMAEEMTNYTLQNVISQSAIAMLAQANQRPQQVLQLLNS